MKLPQEKVLTEREQDAKRQVPPIDEAACARLAAQAPIMARLLLEMAGSEYYPYCHSCGACVGWMEHPVAMKRASSIAKHRVNCAIIAVLRAAGVLPDVTPV